MAGGVRGDKVETKQITLSTLETTGYMTLESDYKSVYRLFAIKPVSGCTVTAEVYGSLLDTTGWSVNSTLAASTVSGTVYTGTVNGSILPYWRITLQATSDAVVDCFYYGLSNK